MLDLGNAEHNDKIVEFVDKFEKEDLSLKQQIEMTKQFM